MKIEFKEFNIQELEAVKSIFEKEGWSAYLQNDVDNKFYQSFGMKPLKEGYMISYFR